MKTYCIITYGCQMNKNDSERITSLFKENGLTEEDEEKADVVLINACSVRQSAMDRLEEKIKKIRRERVNDPLTILTGCVLEKDKQKLFPFFDYLLPIQDLPKWNLPFLEKKEKSYLEIAPKRKGFSAYIPISTGCNNFCAYCVVPFTRGKEVHRSKMEILEEAKTAIKEGCREIWLLGQNVNSYQKEINFSQLLKEVNSLEGDFWIRFTSSHPKDLSEDIIFAMKECQKVTPYLNLPLQSGDDEILKKMNRTYTSRDYKKIVDKTREVIPEIFLSTDIIVGFPGETEKHFNNTAKLFKEIEFDMAYTARYSPRRHTAAYKMEDTVSDKEKKRREKILTEITREVALKKNSLYPGKTLKVLPKSQNRKGLLIGKAANYKDVAFDGSPELISDFVNVEITDYSLWGLKGRIKQK